jgi:hypothetical protein
MTRSPSGDTGLAPALVARVGSICLSLPEAHEQDSWIGVRWRIRQRTFAHLARVDPRQSSVFGDAARANGPVDVLTFRSSGDELAALVNAGYPFYKPPWNPHIVGMVLTDPDWGEVAELLTESYCLLAPQRLSRRVQRPDD